MPVRKPLELDPTILHAALEGGSRAGFRQLYHHYADKVRYAVARAAQRGGHVKNLDELCQEVWYRLLDNERRLLRRYDPARGRFAPFISTVAYQQATVAIGRYRRQLPRAEPELDEDELADDRASKFVDDLVQSDLFHKLIERVDAELDTDERMLIREHFLERRTHASLAAQLGVSENAIAKRSERLKKKLNRMAEELLHMSLVPGSPTPPLTLVVELLVVVLSLGAASHERGPTELIEGRPHGAGQARMLG